ncbi:MAG: excinuclease ABC subunit UvrC, partial [Clostridiales bacterium]|nr:excinuclease ABC subunit UvrC [Clostridiales bacterium]
HVGEANGDESFGTLPDLILLDGGAGHVSVIRQLLDSLGVSVPVFGMVKDEHHKTRTIVSEDGEVSIAREPEVFRFIYRIQEEVHRYTISRMSAAKGKTMKQSSLEKVPGIGPAKAKKLLLHFKTLTALREASVDEVAAVPGVTRENAAAVLEFLQKK